MEHKFKVGDAVDFQMRLSSGELSDPGRCVVIELRSPLSRYPYLLCRLEDGGELLAEEREVTPAEPDLLAEMRARAVCRWGRPALGIEYRMSNPGAARLEDGGEFLAEEREVTPAEPDLLAEMRAIRAELAALRKHLGCAEAT